MNTITSFTKEQLIEIAQENVDVWQLAMDTDSGWQKEYAAIRLRVAEIALASLTAEPVAWTDEQELRDVENSGSGYLFTVNPITQYADPFRVIKLFTVPPAPVVPDDYFSSLVDAARIRADKAMLKFPQPNYILNKVAEESGEVIKEVIHYTEGRGDWNKVEYELIDNLAMLIRLVTEGDQVIGFTPPDVCRCAKGSQPVSNRDELPVSEIECDICGFKSTDLDGAHYCCEDNSDD
ncbi:TPA: hypothetical protein ACKFQ2_000634 [Citrobacter amalonaticus]|uniref:hypothetical protein n=1 Tax=Citrobacter amalonaticus TaxID=35703 RepID=UPI000B768F7D|nr:hypothetical protein [Citrobacter amalonaticus]OUE60038.1 hypothetical protein AZ012_004330 [Citrobacter amalonaticus]